LRARDAAFGSKHRRRADRGDLILTRTLISRHNKRLPPDVDEKAPAEFVETFRQAQKAGAGERPRTEASF
jgi:hypothetical protein